MSCSNSFENNVHVSMEKKEKYEEQDMMYWRNVGAEIKTWRFTSNME